MKSYMEFFISEEKPKTVVIQINSKQWGYSLGQIKWFPGWRQYTFFPEINTVFNSDCLKQIVDFINELKKMKTKEKIMEVYQSGKWGGL